MADTDALRERRAEGRRLFQTSASALTPVTYLNRKSEEEGLVSSYRIYLPLVLKSAG